MLSRYVRTRHDTFMCMSSGPVLVMFRRLKLRPFHDGLSLARRAKSPQYRRNNEQDDTGIDFAGKRQKDS